MDRPADDTTTEPAQLDRLRARLQALLEGDTTAAPEHPVAAQDALDVRDYLLEPPPTPAQLERSERLRRRVRIGSIAVAAVIGLLLLAPVPRGQGDEAVDAEPAGEAPIADAPIAERPQPVRAQRLDVPGTRAPRGTAHVRRRSDRAVHAQRRRAPAALDRTPATATATAPATAPAGGPVRAASPAPRPAPTPAPAASAPATGPVRAPAATPAREPAADAGLLVPVM